MRELESGQVAAPILDVAARLVFGLEGNAGPAQLENWSIPEGGFAWSTGAFSRTRLTAAPGPGQLALEIEATPMVAPPAVPSQALEVLVNDVVVGTATVSAPSILGFMLPPDLAAGAGTLEVTLRHANAVSPRSLSINGDERTLAFAVAEMRLVRVPEEPLVPFQLRPPVPVHGVGGVDQAARFCTGLPARDLVCQFESLGWNCEFGLVQRAMGAEPLGLLRFAGIEPPWLMAALAAGFAGIDRPVGQENVYLGLGEGRVEYMVKDPVYGADLHSGMFVDEVAGDDVPAGMARRLRFMRRHFAETLGQASKICVFHHPAVRQAAQAVPILNRLRGYGPNALLYIMEDDAYPAGTVVQEAAHLFHGYTNYLRPVDAVHRMNVEAWLSICANTYRLWREQGGGF